jgi:ABC-type nickel/cobalt efflux system permease component RcnA
MSYNSGTASGGLGICSVLAIVFIVLKLCKLITWSWWWVLSPIWISWGLVIIVGLIVYFVYKAAENKKW